MSSSSKLPSRRLPGSGRARPMSMFVSPSELLKQKSNSNNNDSGDGDSQEEGSAGSRSTSRLSKRRSLLPQFSRKASGEEKERVQAPPTTEEENIEDDAMSGSATESANDRKAMPPPPKPSRPLSMMRAPGLGLPGRTASLRSHTRKASKADDAVSGDPIKAARPVSMVVKSESGLKRSSSTRLPQSPPRRGVPAVQETKSTHTRTRTSSSGAASVLAEKRPSVSSIKAPSLNTNIRARAPSQTSPTSPTGTSARPSSKSQLPSSSSRPAFNTFQQHYSPAKTSVPKPPVPTSKSAKPIPAPESDLLMTYDLARDQLELLLLALSHEVSSQTLQSFETTAKQTLARRHARLYKDFASLRAREQEARRKANLAALETWCPEPALLSEHLQTLSRVVGDLTALTETGGRYADMTSAFEAWMEEAEPLLLLEPGSPLQQKQQKVGDNDRRTSGGDRGIGKGGFVDGLPESFRATRTALTLKLRAIQHDLSILPPCPPPSDFENPSSLEILVRNCSSLADGMLKELDVMTRLEKEVLRREKARIHEQVEGLLAGRDGRVDAVREKKWVPAWQSVA